MAKLFVPPRALIPLALAALALSGRAETLFSDNFDTDTSANWDVQIGAFTEGDTDYQALWAFDYGTQQYNFFTSPTDPGTARTVPPAPNSTNGITKGLKLIVNKDDTGSQIAVNLYPKTQNLSGNFVLKFDMFMNHGSYADIGGGTTEDAWFGINHLGTGPNWGLFSGDTLSPSFVAPIKGADTSDGCFFALTPDGGASKDLWVLSGRTGSGPAIRNFDTDTGSSAVPDLNGDGVPDHGEVGNFQQAFPSPPFEYPGMLGKRWVGVEVSQVNDVITLKADGHQLAQYTNNSAFKSGKIMIGYSDLFAGVAALPDESWVIFDNVRVEAIRTVVVNTAENMNNPNDELTSLLEALQDQQENDLITFNIPGAGPHTLVTPIGGYPLITKQGIVIDGYSQPGASPNTNAILGGNNASLKIILDSTRADSTPGNEFPNVRSTRLPFPGYGNSENAILGIYAANNVTIRGLSFLSRYAAGTDEDPAIYCIALVDGSKNCKVQGNWFGFAPDGVTVEGSAAGIAAFRYRVTVDGENIDTFSDGLIVGTDSDGVGDNGEFNLIAEQHIGLALELPYLRVTGNYFNLRPDGKTFLNVNAIHEALVAAGADGDSVENIENGRFTDGSVIGVSGDGVNDANERNIFNYAVYDTLTEFYSNADNLRVSGNYYGVGVDGITTAPPVNPEGELPNLISVPTPGGILLGSNDDGVSDDLEGNLIVGVPGGQIVASDVTVPIIARANTMKGNGFTGFPFIDGANGRTYEAYYTGVVVDPTQVVREVTSFENGILKGKIAPPNPDLYPYADVDIYLADPTQDALGVVMPGTFLGTRSEGVPDVDLNPVAGEFEFDLSSLNIPGGQKICVAALYRKENDNTDVSDSAPANPGFAITGPVSNAISTGSSTAIGPITVVLDGTNLRLTWTGGIAPFQVQRRTTLNAGSWSNEGAPVNDHTAQVPITDTTGYFQVLGQ